MTKSLPKSPGVWTSLFPVAFLIFLLTFNVILFGDSATDGPNQLALLLASLFVGTIGVVGLKIPYKQIESGINASLGLALQSMIILLVIGSLSSIWTMSGIVPAMIYYGLKLISPAVFLPVSCLVCSAVSVATGSSWSTSGTIGVALIGIGQAMDIPAPMVAGAVISGAYFGDKVSPLSETTNLASAVTETPLFEHIKHMLYSTLPSFTISIILYFLLGFVYGNKETNLEQINEVTLAISDNFQIGSHLFLVPLMTLFCIMKKIPALPALAIGTLLGSLGVIIFQPQFLNNPYQDILNVICSGFKFKTNNELVDSLLSSGGMSGMLKTIWLIFTAMIFGGAMNGTGMLERLTKSILSVVSGTGSLIGSTLVSCLFINISASDQYLAIVVPGKMFKKAYKDYNLKSKNLSRALEDGGTVTSVLIPWNSGGAYNASVLGVATHDYLPYCFFNLLSPCVSAFLAGMNLSIEKIKDEEQG